MWCFFNFLVGSNFFQSLLTLTSQRFDTCCAPLLSSFHTLFFIAFFLDASITPPSFLRLQPLTSAPVSFTPQLKILPAFLNLFKARFSVSWLLLHEFFETLVFTPSSFTPLSYLLHASLTLSLSKYFSSAFSFSPPFILIQILSDLFRSSFFSHLSHSRRDYSFFAYRSPILSRFLHVSFAHTSFFLNTFSSSLFSCLFRSRLLQSFCAFCSLHFLLSQSL